MLRMVSKGGLGFVAVAAFAIVPAQAAPYLIVGLDQKATWDDRGRPVYTEAGHDALVIADLARPEAPKIVARLPLENSIVGPPTNLAISPDDRLAIVASSVTNRPAQGGGFLQVPSDRAFAVALDGGRSRLVQTLSVGRQPSGLSFNSAGTLALIAYRGETTVGVFRIRRGRLEEIARVEVGGSPSHVAFTPDGRRALVVKQDANAVALLDIEGEKVSFRQDLATTNGPYNVAVTPDGKLGVVNERGALMLIDLAARPAQVTGRVKVELGSEGLAISPRGDLAVSVALRGSNGPRTSPQYHERGVISILRIEGTNLVPIQTIEVGRVPEGIGFAPDGRHFYVANFYDQDVWIFRVQAGRVVDTGKRLRLPGRPASASTSRSVR